MSLGTSNNDVTLVFSTIKSRVKHLLLQLLQRPFVKSKHLHEVSTFAFQNRSLNSGCLGQGTTKTSLMFS